MTIHAIQTGTVRIKEAQRVGRGRGPLRRASLLLSRSWTDPLPIHAWAVETAEGVVVVDTGETARASEPGYFPRWHPYYRLAVRFEVGPDDEVGPQLARIGIRPRDVRAVVLTHLHTDHAGGLRHFPGSEILVSQEELKLASGLPGRLRGYLPDRWPGWFAPKPIAFEATPFGTFDRCRWVTRDGGVVIVPTPGHTPGHVSVVVTEGDLSYFLAGDAAYTERSLVGQEVDGVSPRRAVTLGTLRTILGFCRERPTVFLPTHDPGSAGRLAKMITVAEGLAASR
jgi:glyoxylase-like metal-dependent hydrolase (beta-lactamase superfamily II)